MADDIGEREAEIYQQMIQLIKWGSWLSWLRRELSSLEF